MLAAFLATGGEVGGNPEDLAPLSRGSWDSSSSTPWLLSEPAPDPEECGFGRSVSNGASIPSIPEVSHECSVAAETGFLFKDLHFHAIAQDGTARQVTGFGLIPILLEGEVRMGSDWSAGIGGGGAFSHDVQVVGAGPEITWRFSASHAPSPSKTPETEHYLKAALWGERLEVTKTGFGSFKASLAPQFGYQFRTPLGGDSCWSFQLDFRYEYAPFRYSETVLSGDHTLGGHGLLLGVGLVLGF